MPHEREKKRKILSCLLSMVYVEINVFPKVLARALRLALATFVGLSLSAIRSIYIYNIYLL